ncbi:DUF1648 domain-containing protein [Bacillus sp. DJP31]|uniref:DUF1648 domain-containing protein n=1 Tax=Bacillus sp. DJP31 TaxID=3409789 RepID=UPI003BB578F8
MDLQSRPILEIKKTPLEKILDILAILLFVWNLVYLLMEWSSLPGTIPIHYNALGIVDGYGDKSTVWILPVVGIILWIGLTTLERFPHVYNYMHLTQENVERQYKNARLMINVTKNFVLALFVYLDLKMIQVAYGNETGLGASFLPITLTLTFGLTTFFIIQSFRLK